MLGTMAWKWGDLGNGTGFAFIWSEAADGVAGMGGRERRHDDVREKAASLGFE